MGKRALHRNITRIKSNKIIVIFILKHKIIKKKNDYHKLSIHNNKMK